MLLTVSVLVVLTELLLNLNLKAFKYDIVILTILWFIEKLPVMALLKYNVLEKGTEVQEGAKRCLFFLLVVNVDISKRVSKCAKHRR